MSGLSTQRPQLTPPPPPPPPLPPQQPPATHLGFSFQPTSAEAGAAITPAVKVAALDAAGNTVTGFTGNVTLAIGTNPRGGALTGGGPGAAGGARGPASAPQHGQTGPGQPLAADAGTPTRGADRRANR